MTSRSTTELPAGLVRFLTFSHRNPRGALGLAAGLALFCAWMLPQMRFDFSLEEFFPRESASAKYYREHLERWGRDDDVLLLARPGDPFEDRQAFEDMEERLRRIPGVVDTVSPVSFRTLGTDGTGALAPRPLAPGDDDPLAHGVVMGEDGETGAVVVRIDDRYNHHAAREPLVAQVEDAIRDAPDPWHLGGLPLIRTAYVRLMQADLVHLLPVAMGLSLLIFAWTLRDLRHVAACGLAVLLGVSLTGSVLLLTGASFNLFTPAMLAVVLVVSTSDLVHLVHRYRDSCAAGRNPVDAVHTAVSEVGLACLLTSATTALGFLSLLTTEIPNIRIFGLFTALGVFFAFLSGFLVVPPLLPWAVPRRAVPRERAGPWDGFSAYLSRHPLLPLAGAALLLAAAGLFSSRLERDQRIVEDVRADTTVARDHDFIENHLGGVFPLDVSVHATEAPLTDPEVLGALHDLVERLRADPRTGRVIGVTDLLAHAWQALGQEGLPSSPAAVAQTQLLLEMTAADAVSTLLADEHHGRIRVRILDRGHETTLALVRDLQSWAGAHLAELGVEVRATGVAWLSQEVNRTLVRKFGGSLGLALAVILGAAWLYHRDLRLVGLALVPNLFPLLLLPGFMGLLRIPLQPASAMVFSVGLGIAVDDTIHFLSTYRSACRRGLDGPRAVEHTLRTTGRTLLATTVLLASGFSIFALSDFHTTWTFGVLTACCVAAAFVGDILVLGPLLARFHHHRPELRS